MKKIAMLTVKGAVGLLPLSVKNSLKKNNRLTELYSRSLQRSGLFYGFPSQKKLQTLYKHRLAEQERIIGEMPRGLAKSTLLISGTSEREIAESLRYLNTTHIDFCEIYVDDCVSISSIKSSNSGFNVFPFSEFDKEKVDYLVCIRAGDRLDVNKLSKFLLHDKITKSDIVYFDWHFVDKNRKAVDAQLLPDWNPDLQLSTGYVKTAILITNVSAVFAEYEPENIKEDFSTWIAYLHKSFALSIDHIPFSVLSRKLASLSDHKALSGLTDAAGAEVAGVVDKKFGVVSHMWPLKSSPMVSLIIPTYNGKELVKACIESILEKTTYPNYEILLVDNNSDDPECLRYFDSFKEHPQITVIRYPHPFNYSAINNFAVEHAQGEVIGLVNNDIEVITPQWLEYMAGHAMRDDIGCVGAKLLYSDGRIQHAGVVMGYGGGAGHAHKYFPRYHPGYMNRLIATQNYSAVTAACLLVKKSKYLEVGGLNEVNLHVAFNDVDFCLKVLETGVRNLYCAEAELYHHESVSRGLDISEEKAARFNKELNYLKTKWDKYIKHDPAYNPNLTLKRENFAVKGRNEY